MRSLLFLLLLAAAPAEADTSPTATKAADLARDLGEGLAYHRVQRLPADLPASPDSAPRPVVLDLRYVLATNGDATALEAWVRFRATPRSPILILANTDTTSALLTPFRSHGAAGHVVVIGAAAPGFAPDIAVTFSRADERRAYDAFGEGAGLDALLNDTPDKIRNDEASLLREHPPENGGGDPALGSRLPKPDAPAIPVDRVLLRAVQLHRALLALKKL
ncbi:MAG: hypothetical protein HZA93_26070 [Verrucomicrobia bacterium]|nr:hypothetical protein [Verrucomicrobiota bacterium]